MTARPAPGASPPGEAEGLGRDGTGGLPGQTSATTGESSMDTIRLRRTGSADVTFPGQEIASSCPCENDLTRWHELRLYRVESGGYAVAISYLTRWQGEIECHDVHIVQDASSLIEALEVHDPIAAVQGYPPGEQFRAKQARLKSDLRRRYADQVSDLLRQADITVDAATLGPSWSSQTGPRRA